MSPVVVLKNVRRGLCWICGALAPSTGFALATVSLATIELLELRFGTRDVFQFGWQRNFEICAIVFALLVCLCLAAVAGSAGSGLAKPAFAPPCGREPRTDCLGLRDGGRADLSDWLGVLSQNRAVSGDRRDQIPASQLPNERAAAVLHRKRTELPAAGLER